MDKMSDEAIIARYKMQRNRVKEKNKLWREMHVGDAKLYYEQNKKRLNLRSAELLRQKNIVKKALKLDQEATERETPTYI